MQFMARHNNQGNNNQSRDLAPAVVRGPMHHQPIRKQHPLRPWLTQVDDDAAYKSLIKIITTPGKQVALSR